MMTNNMCDALTNEHRRKLLVALLEKNLQDDDPPIPTGVDAGTLEIEHRLQITMYHTHLPKLEDYGFIRWDKASHEIDKGPQFEEIRPLLEFVDDRAEG